MTAAEPVFFEIVIVSDSRDARALELVGAEAVVLGVSEDETTKEKWFAVQVGDMPVVMLPSAGLKRTGRAVSRESIYRGERLRVSEVGSVLRDASDAPRNLKGGS